MHALLPIEMNSISWDKSRIRHISMSLLISGEAVRMKAHAIINIKAFVVNNKALSNRRFSVEYVKTGSKKKMI